MLEDEREVLIDEFLKKLEDFLSNPDSIDTAVFAMSAEDFLYENEEKMLEENRHATEFMVKELYWPLADANAENTDWFIGELNRLIPQVKAMLKKLE
ncbi:MAG TPA: hypothetical protein PL100_08225 [Bacillota bacterium]|nr:hypothetical protein [Bacillota bacterium]